MNETYEFEDRTYLKPEVDRDERLSFIENLRNAQVEDSAKISVDTHNLGTDVPSIKGGLGGAEGVWNQQYVAPQSNELVAKLRTVAQQSALNTALANLEGQYKAKYDRAYRDYNRRHRGGGGGNPPSDYNGNVVYDPTDPSADDLASGIDTTKVKVSKDSSIRNFMNNWDKYDKNTNPVQKAYNKWFSRGPQDIGYHKTPREYLKHVGGFSEAEIKSYEDRNGVKIN